MIRVIFFAALPPLLLVLLWRDAPDAAILAAWGVGFGVLALGWWRGNLVLTCPHCFKRVKIGASTCHHCGADVVNRSAPGYRTQALEIQRECPHCKSTIRPDASVCPQCRRDVRPWDLVDGVWWDVDSAGQPVWLDTKNMRWTHPSQ